MPPGLQATLANDDAETEEPVSDGDGPGTPLSDASTVLYATPQCSVTTTIATTSVANEGPTSSWKSTYETDLDYSSHPNHATSMG